MRKAQFWKNPVAFLCVIITSCFIIILILSVIRLPETTGGELRLRKTLKELSEIKELGYSGKMMIEMLPEDLVFTAFVPSDKAFSRDLGLKLKQKQSIAEDDNKYAVVSRVMGFSVVPYRVEEGDVAEGETASYDSLCGFTLNIWKKRGGGLVVNGVEAEKTGLRRGKIVVHLMDGVVMDAEFAQSFSSPENLKEGQEN